VLKCTILELKKFSQLLDMRTSLLERLLQTNVLTIISEERMHGHTLNIKKATATDLDYLTTLWKHLKE
jgi:hypothetical protein